MTVLLFFVSLYLIFEDCPYLTIFIFCDLKNKFISGDKPCSLILSSKKHRVVQNRILCIKYYILYLN